MFCFHARSSRARVLLTARRMNDWQPTWWTNEHTSAWDRIKDAMKRDWEQTKHDLGSKKAPDLHQGVSDTVKQAAGKEPLPKDWSEAEAPLRYGYGARHHFKGRKWNDVENDLRTGWERDEAKLGRKWDDVKAAVHRGFHHDPV